MLDDIARCDTNTRKQGDESLGNLSPFVVRNGNHGAFHYGRMTHDRLLNFNGADILAAGNDNVFLAIAQFDCPIRVAHSNIAAMEPAACECFLVAAASAK